jgi:hypothetical protein
LLRSSEIHPLSLDLSSFTLLVEEYDRGAPGGGRENAAKCFFILVVREGAIGRGKGKALGAPLGSLGPRGPRGQGPPCRPNTGKPGARGLREGVKGRANRRGEEKGASLGGPP